MSDFFNKAQESKVSNEELRFSAFGSVKSQQSENPSIPGRDSIMSVP